MNSLDSNEPLEMAAACMDAMNEDEHRHFRDRLLADLDHASTPSASQYERWLIVMAALGVQMTLREFRRREEGGE